MSMDMILMDSKMVTSYMTNVIISNNEARLQGGGYASCPINNTIIYLKEGAALYGNKS